MAIPVRRRWIFWLLLWGMVECSLAFGETVNAPIQRISSFGSLDEVDAWMKHYYLHPEPEKVPLAIEFLAKGGILDDFTVHPLFIAFFGEIFRHNEKRLPSWMKRLDSLRESHKKLLWSALWFSYTKKGKELLQGVDLKAHPASKELIDTLLRQSPPDVLTIPVDSTAVVDSLWGAFQATGNEDCVLRVIEVLPWVNEKSDPKKLLVGGVAKWSLTSNAVQHERVLKICKIQVDKQPQEVQSVLKEVIHQAEEGLRK